MDTWIFVLPDSLLLRVFKLLSDEELCLMVRPTCKRWNVLSYDFSLWKEVCLTGKANLTDKDLVQLLSQIGCHVEKLDISGCHMISSLTFFSTQVYCPLLKAVDISRTNVRNNGLKELLCNIDKFPVLEGVTCILPGLNADGEDEALKITQFYHICCTAYQRNRKLRLLDDPYTLVASAPEDINQGILQIAALFSDLREVSLSSPDLNGLSLEMLCKHNPYIHSLKVGTCHRVSEALVLCSTYLKNLTTLDISFTFLNDAAIIEVAANQPCLERLNISGCSTVTDVGMGKLATICKNLKTFVINDEMSCSGTILDSGLCLIAENCPELEEIKLVACAGITDQGITDIAQKCTKLRSIDVTGCLSLTDKSIIALATHCTNLHLLKASQCVKVTRDSINLIVKNCKKLSTLELETCHYLAKLVFQESLRTTSVEGDIKGIETDTSCVTYFFQESLLSSPCRLTVLNLNFCSAIASDSVKQIAHYCVTLHHLSLRGCFRVNDAAIQAVANKCKLLKVLDVSGSTTNSSRLSDESMYSLANSAASLVMLSVSKNRVVTTSGLRAVIKQCSRLRKLNIDARKELNIKQIIQEVKQLRGSCVIHGMNIRGLFMKEEDFGNRSLIMSFPSLLNTC